MEDVPGALLLVQSGVPEPGMETLEGARHVLGKAPQADIAFDNPYVSRRHAEIAFSNDSYSIRDLGSKNGTFVDGQRVGQNPRQLDGGETIELGLGQVVTTFRLGSSTITLPGPSARPDAARGTATATPPPTPVAPRPAPPKGLHVDVPRREVIVNGKPVAPPLSRKEFDILALLWERMGEACGKDDLSATGWPEREHGSVTDQEISQCVHRLRRRIEPDPATPRFVISIRGFGYRLGTET